MNFSRAKSYLIVFFIFVNLYLIFNLINVSNAGNLSKESIENTVSILSSKGITIDKKLIKKTTPALFNLNLKNPVSDEDFKNSLQGEVEVNENGFVFTPTKPSYSLKDTETSKKNAAELLSSLKDMGFSGKYLEWSDTYDMGNGNFKALYIQKYEGMLIYNAYIEIYFTSTEISSVKGRYYEIESFSKTEKNIKSFAEILIRFSSDVNEKCCVTSVENGYFIDRMQGEFVLISATPCFKITTDTGKTYYYDAVLANLLKTE